MNTNLLGFILSYVLIFIVIGIVSVLLRFNIVSSAIARKMIHLGVSNWWIMAMLFFDNPLYPAVGAASFIVINLISYRKHLFRAMESEIHRENLGTVYFPISLLILSIICFSNILPPYVGAIGILVLGYGDGLAAIVGITVGKHPYTIFGAKKTIEGTAAMAITSVLVVLIILMVYNPSHALAASLVIGLTATIIEAITPYGLDNITVPLASTGIYYILFIG